MSIIFNQNTKTFLLSTPNSSYAVKILENGYLLNLHYGAKLNTTALDELYVRYGSASFCPVMPSGELPGWFSQDLAALEYSSCGRGDFRTNAMQLRRADGTSVSDLRYVNHEIIAGKYSLPRLPATYANTDDEADTLKIFAKDVSSGADITLYYGVFANRDAITRAVSVTNTTDKPIEIEKLASCCVTFNRDDLDMTSFWGHWAKERTPERRPLPHGVSCVGSKRGSSSHYQNPFVILSENEASETAGEAWGFSLVWSGNWLFEADLESHGTVRAVMGVNPTDFGWHLEAGETFYAPEVVMAYSPSGIGELSRTYHKLYRYNLCRGKWRNIERPILINNWEATYMDFNEEKLLSIAKEASELGIEMFVLDDGWFGKRNDDTTSNGDWYVNREKLPDGIDGLAKKIRGLGMRFGLWFEPETVCPISELYRAHPDWILHVPDVAPSLARSEYILDMSRADVCDYIYNVMAETIRSADIDYIKWDFNRNLSEVGSAALEPKRQKEVSFRFVLGTYDVLQRLLDEFPDLLIEGCSGGGGRFDPGMLYYTPQIWTSDDTDAIERIDIQYGTSFVYPPSSMSAHVSASPNHQTGRSSSMKTRGNVAMGGAFGYELDLTQLSQEDKNAIREQVKDYHRFYNVVQNGDYYRLINPYSNRHFCAWEYVSPDKSEVLVTFVVMRWTFRAVKFVKLFGLDGDAVYEDENGKTYSGQVLMSAGLNLSGGYRDGDSIRIYLKKK